MNGVTKKVTKSIELLDGAGYTIEKTPLTYTLSDLEQNSANGVLSRFSKGMKRQTFISLALSIKTKYLLLDEAFDGLDPIVLETIKDEILKTKEEGKTIVISSHNISTLQKLVDTFILISKGKLADNESTERFGQNFIKFQAMFKRDISKDELTKKGLNIVSFRKYGSIYNIVVLDVDNVDEIISSVAPATLLEQVPIDSEEIVKLRSVRFS